MPLFLKDPAPEPDKGFSESEIISQKKQAHLDMVEQQKLEVAKAIAEQQRRHKLCEETEPLGHVYQRSNYNAHYEVCVGCGKQQRVKPDPVKL